MDTESVAHESPEPPVDGTNRLVDEKSPYLLQHATNPVDWYPWGDEAFERARKEDKPIFLSIGYSTCHWCHVMEHESFEDAEVAGLLNESFVSIKVDREERPDVDHVYMTACHLMTGSGGWPLTIVMTPERSPFFAATYIPKRSRFGRSGMLDLLPRIAEAWRDDRPKLLVTAGKLGDAIGEALGVSAGSEPGEEALQLAFRRLASRFDHQNGGFGNSMKFPTPHQLLFLLRHEQRTGNDGGLEMVTKTLTEMRRGGVHDHLGFGFHRYSTDPAWHVPHFEKMLYDQALLMLAYAEAHARSGDPLFADTARAIATYVQRDMTSPDGGFFSAEDADSEGEEGRFYLWTEDEIRTLLDTETADLVVDTFGISPVGNYTDEASGGRSGTNVLHLRGSYEAIAARSGMSPDELASRFEGAREALFAARSKRPRPLLDDKVLTDWNGLMVAALARTSRLLDEPEYARAAGRAAEFVLSKLRRDDGRLLHRFRDGEAALPAVLSDYAFMVLGLIELFQATLDEAHLQRALELNRVMIERFADAESGAFFMTADDAEELLARPVELYDGAIPSGNSVAFTNLVRLARLTGDSSLDERAASLARAFGEDVARRPEAHAMFLLGLDLALGPVVEVVVVGSSQADDTKLMLDALEELEAPNVLRMLKSPGERGDRLAETSPFTASLVAKGDRATAYVCVKNSCSFPTNSPTKMVELIRKSLKRSEG